MKIGDSMFEKIKQLMTGNLSKGGRQVYIDDLRVIATVFVIGVHTVSLAATMTEYGSIPFRVLTIFNFIFLSCNLLFVMLSGALLLPVKNESIGIFSGNVSQKLQFRWLSITFCISWQRKGLSG